MYRDFVSCDRLSYWFVYFRKRVVSPCNRHTSVGIRLSTPTGVSSSGCQRIWKRERVKRRRRCLSECKVCGCITALDAYSYCYFW